MELISLGTAAALKDGFSGLHVIGKSIQYDFDGEAIFELTGERFGLLTGFEPAGGGRKIAASGANSGQAAGAAMTRTCKGAAG